ncbi:MAG: thermonuclease family protein [Planctomycetota bacterium]|nr:thermonuclease family protein [Planctomycetota bacterium]
MSQNSGKIWNAATVDAHLRRRARATRIVKLIFVGIAASVFYNHLLLSWGHQTDDWSTYNGHLIEFVSAPDGESIEVRPAGVKQTCTVRLMGVARLDEDWDAGAQRELSSMLGGEHVVLHLEPTQTRDAQGRLIAYAYAEDGRAIAVELVRQGLALADRRMPYAFHGAVEQAESEARKKKLGLWKHARDSAMPSWRQEWFGRRRSGQKPAGG